MASLLKKERVRTCFKPIESVTVSNILQMYDLYQKYYDNTSLDVFMTDLSKKSGVIVLTRTSDDVVVGFSTQTFFNIRVNGRQVRGIFSGDTIVERDYWGCNGLTTAFYRRLIVERLKHPFVPFYWFLISKGYKTYLLMSNNFYKFYPNPHGENPLFQKITAAYCQELFPDAFDADKMLLDFGERYVRLKADVAAITPDLSQSNPHIAFFEQINPTWRRGTEAPCLAAFDFETLLRSLIDVPWKWLKKHVLGTHPRAEAHPTTPNETVHSGATHGH